MSGYYKSTRFTIYMEDRRYRTLLDALAIAIEGLDEGDQARLDLESVERQIRLQTPKDAAS